MSTAAEPVYVTSGLVRLTKPQLIGTMTGLLLGTVSIPVLAVPLSLVGCFRLPETRGARIALALLVPVGAAVGVALPYFGRSLIAG